MSRTNENPAALPPDYHTHNTLCKHAEGLPLDYAESAAHNGVPQIASTDHCPTDDRYGQEHRMELEQFPLYLERVRTAQQDGPVPVLLGIEADYYRRCERFLDRHIERNNFDLILGSVHFLNYWGKPSELRTLGSKDVDPEIIWQRYFELIGELADTRLYNIVAHLDLPKRFGNPIAIERLREYALPALDRIANAGMAIEINTSGLNHNPRECYPSLPLLQWACERGIGLTFGSDSHHPSRVGDGFDVALQLAREAGFQTSRHYRQRSFTEVPLPKGT
ncbi:MAG: histidinol-phosphatase [Kiritimatiellae bacterium]|nr:histidinol-phosphatase [Kiritimatiellia bacterium]MCO5060470.1 histidinol-phosphatase [Kiritimatiellia bacterium]MCO6400667.1 histidinol-phosphatase [Verrucomicrobiota bacterium]